MYIIMIGIGLLLFCGVGAFLNISAAMTGDFESAFKRYTLLGLGAFIGLILSVVGLVVRIF